MNLLQQYEQTQLEKFANSKQIPNFKAGDTVEVHVEIQEGNTKRVQIFKGLCIKRRNRSIASTFTVKKISNGEGVERTFQLYSPRVVKINVLKSGKVRRAKLYYMRDRDGKAARIQELSKFGSAKSSS